MKGKNNTGELAMIKVDTKLHRVRAKENIDAIYINAIYPDSVILKMSGELKTIYK